MDPAKQFIKAAKKGDIAVLQSLLKADRKLLGARDSDGSTALHCATWKGQEATVAWLISAGVDVHAHNENDHWGTTATCGGPRKSDKHREVTNCCRS